MSSSCRLRHEQQISVDAQRIHNHYSSANIHRDPVIGSWLERLIRCIRSAPPTSRLGGRDGTHVRSWALDHQVRGQVHGILSNAWVGLRIRGLWGYSCLGALLGRGASIKEGKSTELNFSSTLVRNSPLSPICPTTTITTAPRRIRTIMPKLMLNISTRSQRTKRWSNLGPSSPRCLHHISSSIITLTRRPRGYWTSPVDGVRRS